MPEKCVVCTKTVYEMEKQAYDAVAYHKWCFKCQMCQCTLSLANVAKIKGDIFCKPCFKKTFKEAGSYASFGPKNLAANAPVKDLIAAGVFVSQNSGSTPSTPSVTVSEPSTPIATVVSPTTTSTFTTPKQISQPVSPKEVVAEPVTPIQTSTPTIVEVEEKEVEKKESVAEVKKDEESSEMVVEEMDIDSIMQLSRMDIKTPTTTSTTTTPGSAKPSLSLNTAATSTTTTTTSTPTPTSATTPSYGKRGSVFITNTPKCHVCTKSVYEMEKVSYNDRIFHKWCLKCQKCSSNIGVGSVASDGNEIYCKPCFKKTFKEAGNYSAFNNGGNTPVTPSNQ